VYIGDLHRHPHRSGFGHGSMFPDQADHDEALFQDLLFCFSRGKVVGWLWSMTSSQLGMNQGPSGVSEDVFGSCLCMNTLPGIRRTSA
jgi:hypothetical protein